MIRLSNGEIESVPESNQTAGLVSSSRMESTTPVRKTETTRLTGELCDEKSNNEKVEIGRYIAREKEGRGVFTPLLGRESVVLLMYSRTVVPFFFPKLGAILTILGNGQWSCRHNRGQRQRRLLLDLLPECLLVGSPRREARSAPGACRVRFRGPLSTLWNSRPRARQAVLSCCLRRGT